MSRYYRGKHETQEGHKRKRAGGLTGGQKALIVLIAVLSLALVLALVYKSIFVKPAIPGLPSSSSSQEETNGKEEKLDYGDGIRPKAGGARKSENWYTVLILGRDTGGGGNTDTMLLASYDVTNQKATVMSIPRDTMVNVSWDIKKINSVYNYYGGGEKGISRLYQEISQLVGFEPGDQAVVEWAAVGEIVDAMGGVYFDVPRNMNYDDPTQDLHIHQTKGYRKLSGDDAMQVIRYRHDNKKNGKMLGYADGDLGRIKTQQAFLKAMVEQLLQLKNVTKIGEFAKVFKKNVETDLSFNEMLWFGKQAVMGGLKVENVNFVTMPNRNVSCWSRSVGGPLSYVVPIGSELLELVNNELSPFTEKFTYSDLDIMSVNADGSISSSTGHVEDAKAAKAPVKPSGKPVERDPDDEPIVDNKGEVIDPGTGEIISGPSGGQENTGSGGASSSGASSGSASSGSSGSGQEPGGETGNEGGETGGEPAVPEEPGTGENSGGDTGSSGGETTGGVEWVLPGGESGEPAA